MALEIMLFKSKLHLKMKIYISILCGIHQNICDSNIVQLNEIQKYIYLATIFQNLEIPEEFYFARALDF